MTDSFHEREKGYEAKFKLDEEFRFKAEVRRNKRIGLWAAERMGLAAADREAYAKQVVASDFEEVGSHDVLRKLVADFQQHGIKVSEDEIRAEMARLYGIALEEVAKEYPNALG
jgi:hypothetical protein